MTPQNSLWAEFRSEVLEVVALQTKEGASDTIGPDGTLIEGDGSSQRASNALLRKLWLGIANKEPGRTTEDGMPTCHVPRCAAPQQVAAMRLGTLDAPGDEVLHLQVRCTCGLHLYQYPFFITTNADGDVTIMAKI